MAKKSQEELVQEIFTLDTEIKEKDRQLGLLKKELAFMEVQDYAFESIDGKTNLSELFQDKEDLIVIHNMGKHCAYCTMWADGFNGVLPHIRNRTSFVVISPDKGAVERSKAFAQHFGENVPVDCFEKHRDVKTGDITMSGKLSLKDKDVVVSDDIIATGGTMVTAIKLAKESGGVD